jgi:hypothetical protein
VKYFITREAQFSKVVDSKVVDNKVMDGKVMDSKVMDIEKEKAIFKTHGAKREKHESKVNCLKGKLCLYFKIKLHVLLF